MVTCNADIRDTAVNICTSAGGIPAAVLRREEIGLIM